MTKLISNTLACSFNFKGTEGSGKKSFQNLHLWEVVQGMHLKDFENYCMFE